MAHELDITASPNGPIASFAAAHTPAWHRLGTVLPHAMTVTEALDAAHLAGWNVRKLDTLQGVEITEDGVNTIAAPDRRMVIRTNPITGASEYLGVVGEGFHHVQNEELAEFLEALLDQSGARFLQTAGALRGGRQVFYSAKLPEGMLIGGVDPVDLYATAMNGHDGTMAMRVVASPIRVVCANTQAAAIGSARQTWATKHTKGATKAIDEARKALNMTWEFAQAFEGEAERMIQETLTLGEFEKIVEGLFPEKKGDESPRTRVTRLERMGTMRRLWTAPTQTNIAGTRWAGYQVIGEYVDHFARAQGRSTAAKDSARALSAVIGQGATLKAAAFDAFRVPVKA